MFVLDATELTVWKRMISTSTLSTDCLAVSDTSFSCYFHLQVSKACPLLQLLFLQTKLNMKDNQLSSLPLGKLNISLQQFMRFKIG